MKNYIILAILPIFMQANQLCAESKYKELNIIIKDELVAAQKTMHVGGKPELELVADALGNYSQKGGQHRQIAIDYLMLIKKAVQECNDAQYTGWWHQNFNYLFYGHPDLVKNETRPALEYIDNILNKKIQAKPAEIGTANNNIPLIAATISAAVLVGGGIAIATYKWWNNDEEALILAQMDNVVGDFTAETAANQWASVVTEAICKKNSISPSCPEHKEIFELALEISRFHFNDLSNSIDIYNPKSSVYKKNQTTEIKKYVLNETAKKTVDIIEKYIKNKNDYAILGLDYNIATAQNVDKKYIALLDQIQTKKKFDHTYNDQEDILTFGAAYNKIIKTDKYIQSQNNKF